MSALELRVLGPFTVVRAGRPVAVGRSKQRDLLALLAVHAPKPVASDAITDALWHGVPPPSARKVVQKHVSELRQLLGRGHVVSLPGGYALRAVGVDSAIFEAALDRGRLEAPAEAVERLAEALAMWRGEPYEDVDLEVLAPVRSRLHELHLGAIERWIESRLTLGAHASVIADLERLIVEHPTRESLWGQLARALYAAGRHGEALRAIQRVRAALAYELGIEPSGELRRLEERILTQDLDAPPRHDAEIGEPDAQRRVMTILSLELGDVAGDAAGDDPEARARAVTATVEWVASACRAAEGTVESAMGSRLMLVFGDPAHEDDADRAVRLAHELIAGLPSGRVAVATGWALVQPPGTAGTRVVGSVVEVACSALTTLPAGCVHVDRTTIDARSRPVDEPPFLGRDDELAVLSELVARTTAGRGPHAVSVRGEPGIGKSRLITELRRRSPTGLAWREVRCVEGAIPAGPLQALLLGELRATDAQVAAERFDELLTDLAVDPSEREWLRRRLGPMAADEEPDVVERSEVVAAWVTYFVAIARRQPTVIVFDDVHRADPAFVSLLTDCLAQLRDVALMVVLTARPDRPEWSFTWAGTDQVALTLRGLASGDVDALLGHLLDDDPVTSAQYGLVCRRSGGNPLYAIHFARMLRQQGWKGTIPFSTQALIAARLDLLAPLERALLSAAAVADQPFDIAEVAEMQGIDDRSAAVALRHLVDRALLAWDGRQRMWFSHDLVREVAYEGLVRGRRAALHEAAASWLEQHAPPHHLADDAMRIANHLGAAARAREEDGDDAAHDLRRRAFRLMLLAGDSLRGLGMEDVAGRLADAADGDHAPADLASLHHQRAAVLARLGRLSEAADAAQAGVDVARQATDPSLQARLEVMVGEVHWLRGETAAALTSLRAAMDLVHDAPRNRAAAEALPTIAFVTALLGQPAEAVELADRGLALAREHALPEKEVRCLNARGAALLLLGRLDGYTDFMRALTLALEAGLSHESAMAYHNLAELEMQGVGTASSTEMNQRGLDLAERRGLSLAADWLRANRVQLCFEAGRWDEALDMAAGVMAGERQSGPGQAGTACAVWAARVHVWRGELDDARRLLDVALPRARQHAVIQQLGPALVVAALVAAAGGDPEAGARLAGEFCDITAQAPAYRHMEIADVARLLVAVQAVDRARTVCSYDAIPAIRNQCQSATARATIALAGGDPGAPAAFCAAAGLWQQYGHPLEEHLALVSADAVAPASQLAERAAALAAELGVSSDVVETLRPRPPTPGA
jgi:DNA-binding SARP family transcriptional activator/tetratricopeptide (TPR) repeat protein